MAHASLVLARRDVGIGIVASVLILFGSGCDLSSTAPTAAPPLALSGAWKPVDRSTWLAPGVRLAAWSGPSGSSLTVYRKPPIPEGTAEQIVESMVNRMTHLPGFQVVERRVETIAGVPAARVEIVAPGTGSEIAPSGLNAAVAPPGATLTPTREITVGFARSEGALFLVWRMPESARDAVAPEVDSTLAALALPPDRTPATSRY
ncbi:hypothetical protein [Planctomyces sp. SH-PL62]|uniref:hypothetical protein n=1 Tax=Planctomyces sp. SH-PL62 TaxID=1636152 RepID=UPI00078C33AC|nr:hypothetical protein [Planctomyces sp. SH-PL62]AMV38525.1 hypothetical protein VT85_13900 [Planctomyces sp. SH-PL62]